MRPLASNDELITDESNIFISILEYKELLIIKGKYEELKNNKERILNYLLEQYEKGKINPNQIREILGFTKLGG